ncbi:hypothetical protein ACFVW8_29580 [Streptomyces sp. NPDC058221]|uniref:hypothetical protein n=1 Tax=Streptomyces sp. NPDC058221 TaxID=3346388 RepID=UPI0036E4E7BD
MSPAPTVNGQVIGQAHYATRAVLERLLAGSGTTFHQCVALNAIADSDGTIERRRLADRMTATLKIAGPAAESTLSELVGAGLLAELPGSEPQLTLTAAGRELHRTTSAGTAGITARLYADLPAEDLATAGRVLTVVTARANAVLAEG